MSRRSVLDVANGAPLYQQLRRELFSRIRRGEFGAGARLPSENQLCEEYGVSVTTARRALLELVNEGVIRRRAGVGTMVGSRVRQAHIAVLSVDYVGDAWRETSAAMGELIAGVGELTWKRDASLSMSGVEEEHSDDYLSSLVEARSVDGVLLRTANDVHHQHVDILEAAGLPYVVIKRELPGRPLNCIVSDDVLGARLATKHLLERGHRRLGFVCAKASLTLTQARLASFRQELEASGVAFDPNLVRLETSFAETMGRRAVRELLMHRDRPTAIFAASDTMAIGGYMAARSLGLTIPDDVAFVGYDDISPAALLEPPLTTIRTSYYDFGELAARLLLDLIEGRAEPPQRIVIKPELVVRQSTGQSPEVVRELPRPSSAAPGSLAGRRVLVAGGSPGLTALLAAGIAADGGQVLTGTGRSAAVGGFEAAAWTLDLRRELGAELTVAHTEAEHLTALMAQRRSGALLLVALVPDRVVAGLAAAATAGFEELVRSVAAGWSSRGVRVNGILVGGVESAGAVAPSLFLLSDASQLSGQVLRTGEPER